MSRIPCLSSRTESGCGFASSIVACRKVLCLALAIFGFHSTAMAQFGFVNRVVGGVSIDANGTVRDAVVEDQTAELEQLRQRIAGGKNDFAAPAARRMISLKQLQATVADAARNQQPLAEEVLLLGGLTRIEYVFVYPEEQDIVIAGPSENWKLGKYGTIVGAESGRPILLLDDLVVAFQSVSRGRPETISCSIDPTPEGTRQLTAMLNQVRLAPNSNPASFEPAMKKSFRGTASDADRSSKEQSHRAGYLSRRLPNETHRHGLGGSTCSRLAELPRHDSDQACQVAPVAMVDGLRLSSDRTQRRSLGLEDRGTWNQDAHRTRSRGPRWNRVSNG